jgi:kynureninase
MTIQEPHWSQESFAHHQDQLDSLKHLRQQFCLPRLGSDQVTHYLCGNSLGPMPIKAKDYVDQELEKWKQWGVEGHFTDPYPWLSYHEPLAPLMAPIVGALDHEVVICNTLTVNLHLLMVSFFRPHGKKRKILVEQGAFPSDLYAIKSQLQYHGLSPKLDLIECKPRPGEETLRTEDILQTIAVHADSLALILVGGINYRTGQLMPLKEMANMAQQHHISFGVDLAHAAGNVLLELHQWGVDFAVWCTYKYLNGGPGSLGGLFVHEKHHKRTDLQRFAGWWGHNKEGRFHMDDEFDAIPTAEGWQLSNPPIFSLASLRASLEIFAQVPFPSLINKSHQMTNYLVQLLDFYLGDDIQIITPTHCQERGGQISFILPQDLDQKHPSQRGRELVHYLKDHHIICDFRSPYTIRVTAAPLYNTYHDLFTFVKTVKTYIDHKE